MKKQPDRPEQKAKKDREEIRESTLTYRLMISLK